MKRFILGFFCGVVVTSLLAGAYYRFGFSPVYDQTLRSHLLENIVNAQQIRAGRSDEVLERIDTWLRGSEIERSIEVFVVSGKVETDMLERLGTYRSASGNNS